VADSTMTKNLLDQIQGPIKITMADGAYDCAPARSAIGKRGSKALIPPPKNASYKRTESDRDKAISIIEGLGGGREGRSLWGKLTGYSVRVLVESTFSRMKRLFGERLFSKIFEKQLVENRLRCVILNRIRYRENLPDELALGFASTNYAG
jgi:Transposase DDE domain